MPAIETNFKVIRNEAGEVIGMELESKPDTPSEIFCSSFPMAAVKRDACIRFEGNEIIFHHPTCGQQGRCAHELSDEDIASLKQFLRSGPLKFEHIMSLSDGFKVVRE